MNYLIDHAVIKAKDTDHWNCQQWQSWLTSMWWTTRQLQKDKVKRFHTDFLISVSSPSILLSSAMKQL